MPCSTTPAQMTQKQGVPLLVCAGGKSSGDGTEVPAVKPLDTSLM